MKTPIVRVFEKSGDILFYDERKFKEFEKNSTKSFKSKYYKGLGTTKIEDVPDTFGEKMIEYNNDEEKTNKTINLVFNKKEADSRKNWLENFNPDVSSFSLDECDKLCKMDMSLFLNEEMIKFSLNDCRRSIPSLFDGLKESQRKVLYAIKKRKLTYNKQSLKVAQLAGYVAEHTNYHHGEQNLYDTIVKMAQEFQGSNNIPLLYRDGQFGSLLELGADAANARYIFTKMEKLTPLLFREEDDVLLDYLIDDGDKVEPAFYIPILPMILINGCRGIGTGWSSNVPCFNPLDVVECVKTWIENDGIISSTTSNDEEGGGQVTLSLLPDLIPYFRGFNGTIEKVQDNKFISYGIVEKEKNKAIVSEIPINMSINSFKEMCEDWLCEKKIKNFHNNSTPYKPNFTLTESDDGFTCNVKNLKLSSFLFTSNMVLFNEKNQIKKYSIEDIISSFCEIRFFFYKKRKAFALDNLKKYLRVLENKARFVKEVIENTLNIMNVKEEIIIDTLRSRGYDRNNLNEDQDNNNNDEQQENNNNNGYEYLLRLQVRTFTENKVKQLNDEILSKKNEISILEKTKEKDLWLKDINEFVIEYNKWLNDMKKITENVIKKNSNNNTKKRKHKE